MKNYTASFKTYKINGVKQFEATIYENGKRVFRNIVDSREKQLKFTKNFIQLVSKPQSINA